MCIKDGDIVLPTEVDLCTHQSVDINGLLITVTENKSIFHQQWAIYLALYPLYESTPRHADVNHAIDIPLVPLYNMLIYKYTQGNVFTAEFPFHIGLMWN